MEKDLPALPGEFETIIVKSEKTRKSEIELAGEQVMDHLMQLGRASDMSYSGMAKRIKELYKLEFTPRQIMHFFKTNGTALLKLAEEQKSLSKIRADLYLEHSGVLVKDIKILDDQIEKIMDTSKGGEGQFLEVDVRAKVIGDLIDRKGRLLIRHARLSGKLNDTKIHIGDKQQNIFLQVNDEKSELINRLKKAEFKEEKVIDIGVKDDKVKKTDTN